MLERLRGEHDPLALLQSVPGIGKVTAWKLYEDLGIESLEELEAAAQPFEDGTEGCAWEKRRTRLWWEKSFVGWNRILQ
jgi:DNA polymerase/3'-5' exonuclease PolX